MIKKLYIDNFRTLTNFSIEFDNLSLLLGGNGAGKSSVFIALFRLRIFLTGAYFTVGDLFLQSDINKANKNEHPAQTFELVLEENGDLYEYRLAIEYSVNEGKCRVKSESLKHNSRPLFRSESGKARLYRDDYSEGPELLMDWSRSGVGALQPSNDNKKLMQFRNVIGNIYVFQINPLSLLAEAKTEDSGPRPDLSNFAAWYRYLSQSNQGQVFKLTEHLREMLPGFEEISLLPFGDAKILVLYFRYDGQRVSFRFDQLSDGQKLIVALYTILFCTPDEGVTLCIDEPENFLALPEIQPWLNELDEQVQAGAKQALLISHHPRVINFLAKGSGKWLYRDPASLHTRVKPITDIDHDGLSPDRLVELGWLVDE